MASNFQTKCNLLSAPQIRYDLYHLWWPADETKVFKTTNRCHCERVYEDSDRREEGRVLSPLIGGLITASSYHVTGLCCPGRGAEGGEQWPVGNMTWW